MSGLEIAGVLLGTFPLIISGLEHWRGAAKVGGFFWRVRKEHTKCCRDVQYHEILYRRNLKELLLPIVNDADEVARLVGDPGGKGWTSKPMQERLEERLQESYGLYMEIIRQMTETADELRRELCLDNTNVQSKLAPPEPQKQRRPSSPQPPSKSSKLASTKTKWDYETFRIKFSFNDPVRSELFEQLRDCNGRLEKLLGTSDKISTLENAATSNPKHVYVLETAFKKARENSDHLFKAIQRAWQCSCQQYHYANLRLEHRRLPEICFELILMFVAPSAEANIPWSWRELQCGQTIDCAFPQKLIEPPNALQLSGFPSDRTPTPELTPPYAMRKKVMFTTCSPSVPKIELDIPVRPNLQLCELLGSQEGNPCIGMVRHADEEYHLHPSLKRRQPKDSGPLTLDRILSSDYEAHLTRRQSYSIALLLASSVAQLQFTPWLKTGLTKKEVLFFPCENDDCSVSNYEPFICRGFPLSHQTSGNADTKDCNFYSLGILLLELCFRQRLEDHPLRQRYPVGAGEEKEAFDLVAALKWSQSVCDEAGVDYASAVKWCFTGTNNADKFWRSEMIKNVVWPLEMCQEYFKIATVS
ncbi:uncharacterized protein K460DRAFT_354745 [Cucurbitaria berberidis CBS 394.84]|uniref:DUF7580 domain-containing protein n=1 Tax=Cucurbitaria berberidis CBS 394.84 TaxID=1168544 RepID=A0A9P4GG86_9PLEO|nr:uncharacterized protein K460DRAFT_354745 [Cucurbitaria berberidis CBS 394.84]KAF1844874.1 hypothetical protein K460DRAFT_354745 [Cucurbitaria berberidis CBS 394.84]